MPIVRNLYYTEGPPSQEHKDPGCHGTSLCVEQLQQQGRNCTVAREER